MSYGADGSEMKTPRGCYPFTRDVKHEMVVAAYMQDIFYSCYSLVNLMFPDIYIIVSFFTN